MLLACDAEGVFTLESALAAHPLHAYVIDTAGGESAVALTAELRRAGLRADRAFDGRSMKSQIKSADRSGALVALVVGPQELEAGTVGLRPLRSDAEQRSVPRAAIVEELKAFLAESEPADADRIDRRASTRPMPFDGLSTARTIDRRDHAHITPTSRPTPNPSTPTRLSAETLPP